VFLYFRSNCSIDGGVLSFDSSSVAVVVAVLDSSTTARSDRPDAVAWNSWTLSVVPKYVVSNSLQVPSSYR